GFSYPSFIRFILHRKSSSKHPFLVKEILSRKFCHLFTISHIATVSEDEDPSSPLSISIFRCVDYTPFHIITKLMQGGKHHCKIPASLLRGGFEESIHIFQQYVLRYRILDEACDFPEEHTFLPGDAQFPVQRSCYGIILTWETSDNQISVCFSHFFICHFCDIFIYMLARSKSGGVAIESMLHFLAWFPLIGPSHIKSIQFGIFKS